MQWRYQTSGRGVVASSLCCATFKCKKPLWRHTVDNALGTWTTPVLPLLSTGFPIVCPSKVATGHRQKETVYWLSKKRQTEETCPQAFSWETETSYHLPICINCKSRLSTHFTSPSSSIFCGNTNRKSQQWNIVSPVAFPGFAQHTVDHAVVKHQKDEDCWYDKSCFVLLSGFAWLPQLWRLQADWK